MNKIKGFTLIEVIVVSAILLILAATIFPAMQTAKKGQPLERAAYKLAQDLAYLEQKAWETKIYEPLGTMPTGYGIYFRSLLNTSQTTFYDLYAECSTILNQLPSFSCGSGNANEVYATVDIEKGVQISKVCQYLFSSGEECEQNPNGQPLILFKPSQSVAMPRVPGYNLAVITLSLKDDPSKTKKVLVNFYGLIEVE